METALYVIALIFIAYVVWHTLTRKKIKIVEYTVQSDKIKNGESVRITQITDFHCTRYGNKQRKLTDLIGQTKPDALIFTGDIAEQMVPETELIKLLDGIRSNEITRDIVCYAVRGNHDDCLEFNLNDVYEKYNVRLLEKGSVEYYNNSDIIFYGLKDLHHWDNKAEFFANLNSFDVDPKKLNILLSHRPEYIREYSEKGFDITFHGHAHGGQVIIPHLINGLYAPGQGLFPKYAGGLYVNGNTASIVCCGLCIRLIPRVFNPPEIAVINIVPTDDKLTQ